MTIDKKDFAHVFAALYNNATPQGLGFLQYTENDMTAEEAQKIVDASPENNIYVDYFNGRVMKIEFVIVDDKVEFDTFSYNRDNGVDKAENIVQRALSGDISVEDSTKNTVAHKFLEFMRMGSD